MKSRLEKRARFVASTLALAAAGALLHAQAAPVAPPTGQAQGAPASGEAPGAPPNPAGPTPAAAVAQPGAVTQPGPATRPDSPGRSIVAPGPATRPAWQRGPTSRPAQQLSLHFKDASADAVLTYLSQTAGFIIMKDVPVDGRVNIDSEQPVTPDEALILINAALKTNGLTAIQQGRILRIVRKGDAKKSSIPVRYGNKPEEIPESD
ncbi:MAG: gspD 1 [Phycisphaerales bacterium]|nr:gspD 1 [Phycisphaerales bacterium]